MDECRSWFEFFSQISASMPLRHQFVVATLALMAFAILEWHFRAKQKPYIPEFLPLSYLLENVTLNIDNAGCPKITDYDIRRMDTNTNCINLDLYEKASTANNSLELKREPPCASIDLGYCTLYMYTSHSKATYITTGTRTQTRMYECTSDCTIDTYPYF
jgi:hypothetical protein